MMRVIALTVAIMLSSLLVDAYGQPEYSVSAANSMRRISRDQQWNGPSAEHLSLQAAANEYESLQLVIATQNKPLRDVQVVCNSLFSQQADHQIAAANIRARQIGYVYCDIKPVYGPVGWYPDLLLNRPEFNIAPRTVQPVWLTVYVPPATPAGQYTGTVTVRPGKAPAMSIPLTLKVWDFELPQQSRFPTDFNLRPNLLAKFFYGSQAEANWPQYLPAEVYRQWLGFLLRYRLTPKMYDEACSRDADGKLTRPGYYSRIPYLGASWQGDKLKLNWSEVDRNIEFCLERGAPLICVGYPGHASLTGDNPRGRFWRQYLPQLHTHLQQRGWLERSYIYCADEPSPDKYPMVQAQTRTIKQLAPGLKCLLPYQAWGFPEQLRGSIDIWVPMISHYKPAAAHRRQAKGDIVWAYTCCGALRFPNFFIRDPFFKTRLLPWVMWKYNIEGLLYYGTVCWPWLPATLEDINEDGTIKPSWSAGLGGGCLIYPGGKSVEDEPQPSIRLELIRDGLEDWEYFYLLRQRVIALREQRADAPLLGLAEDMLKVPASLVAAPGGYTEDPQAILAQRKAIAQIIEKLPIL